MAESANVEIVVSAFTDAAQDALDSVGDHLNNLSADAEPAEAAAEGVADQLDDATRSALEAAEGFDQTDDGVGELAAAMLSLREATDEAEDELEDAAADAVTSAQAFGVTGEQAQDLALSLAGLQSAGDEAGDELNDAGTSAFLAGRAFGTADGPARGLALALYALQSGADEASDELNQATLSATGATGAFGALTTSVGGLNVGFRGLSAATLTVLIPALLALLTTLIPIAATLAGAAAAATGLAGAFGAVIGTGILAYGDQLADQNKERLNQINDEISALQELKRQRSDLTDAERAELKAAQNTVDALQQKRDTTGDLTAAERSRLAQAQDTVDTLNEQRETEGALTDDEQKRLETLKAKREELKEQTSVTGALAGEMAELKEEIAPLLIQFGQQFIPLIAGAVDALPELVKNVLDAVGGMGAFKAALGDAGQAAMTAIPNLVGGLMNLARDALPALQNFAGWLSENGGSMFDAIMDTTSEMVPVFLDFFDAVVASLPGLNKLGSFILKGLLPALGDLLRVTGRFLEGVNFQRLAEQMTLSDRAARALSAGVDSLVRGIIAILPILRELFNGLMERGVPAFGAAINLVGKLAQAFGSLPLWAQEAALIAVLAVIGALGGPLTALAAAVGIVALAWDDFSAGIDAAVAAGNAFIDWAQSGLKSTINGIAGWVTSTYADIASATSDFFFDTLPAAIVDALAILATTFEGWGVRLQNIFATIWNAILNVGTSALQGLINLVINGLNSLLETIDGVSDAVSEIPGVDAPDVDTLEQVSLETSDFEAERQSFDRQAARRRNEAAAREVVLDVRGDNPLAEFIRENVESEQNRRERQQTRRTRRQRPTE